MKCPKCQYIAFDQGGRCRNCGYEFSLSADTTDLDLPIRTGDETDGPLSDFTLAETDEAPGAASRPPAGHSRSGAQARPSRSTELPLFRDRVHQDDAPLVSLPAAPRAPISVRKSAVVRQSRQRPVFDEPALDLEPDVSAPRTPAAPPRQLKPAPSSVETMPAGSELASAGARLLAGAIDLLLLGAIDAAVLYLTLLFCDLTFAEVTRIPLAPLMAFVALLNGGYMVAFTAAGGQSIGKMITRIRVVTMDEGSWTDRVRLGQACLRAVGYLVSALPAGLGFVPALFGTDRRGLHDRLAHTRVVKA